MSNQYVQQDPEVRFWAKVDKSGKCWLWTAGKNNYGYGNFKASGRVVGAHRFAYELANGPIPEGLVIDHRCHVRHCVNPDHLRVATIKQNTENRSYAEPIRGNSGAIGVTWRKGSRKWRVQVKHNQALHMGGEFSDLNEAAEAARQLRLSLFTHNDLDRRAS